MLMRKKGYIKTSSLFIDDKLKCCPYNSQGRAFGLACGVSCALFDTIVHDTTGKIIGAYLGCIDKQWTFKNGEEEI